MKVEEEDNSIVIPCPNPDCNEKYEVDLEGIDLTETLTDNCEDCGNKVRVYDDLTTSQESFNLHCIKEDGRYFTSEWKRKDEKRWEKLS